MSAFREFRARRLPHCPFRGLLGVHCTLRPAYAHKFDFPFPLLCDTDRAMSIAYGACDSADAEYPQRITYVIGSDGKIELALATKDPAAQAAELLAALSGAPA